MFLEILIGFASLQIFCKYHFLPSATKETSYVYSIVAAGMAFSMTRACLRGTDPLVCPCLKKKTTPKGLQCQQNLDQFFKKARRVMMNYDYKRVDIPENRRNYNWRNIVTGLQVWNCGFDFSFVFR